MTGYCLTAFEDEQVLVFSPDYLPVKITFSKQKAIAYRLFRFIDKQLVVRKQASG